MRNYKADFDSMLSQDPELKGLARASRYILLRSRAKKVLWPRCLAHWVILGGAAFLAGLVSLLVLLPGSPYTPCGAGSSWTTIRVNSAAHIKGAEVTVTATSKGTQKSVTVQTPPHTGIYHVIGVTPDVGIPTDTFVPVKNGIATLNASQFLGTDGYGIGAQIASVDVCRQPGSG